MLKHFFKLYNKRERYLIKELIMAFEYCISVIEYYQDNGEVMSTGFNNPYQLQHGLCRNINNFMYSVLGPSKFSEDRNFISVMMHKAFSKTKDFSGNVIFPIKSPWEDYDEASYYGILYNKYDDEHGLKRIKLAQDSIAYLKKRL